MELLASYGAPRAPGSHLECRALIVEYGPLLIEYRALLIEYRLVLSHGALERQVVQ